MNTLNFLTSSIIHSIQERYTTPVFVYSEVVLRAQAQKVKNFSNSYGLTPRYAMKTSPNMNILSIFHEEWLHIDASSEYEVYRALHAGIPPEHIQLTGQEMPKNLEKIVLLWVEFNATSLHQLESYGKLFPGTNASIRLNPGMGSGGTKRTNTGGVASSFGIWHGYLDWVFEIAKKYNLTLIKLHTHIGSGSDPEVWKHVASLILAQVEKIPTIRVVSLGGGFKVARMYYEKNANLEEIWNHVQWLFEDFYKKTGRKLHLEIEPGTFLAANSASLVTEIIDIVDTGMGGYNFIKVNAWMTEVTRPSLYGAQHPIIVVPRLPWKVMVEDQRGFVSQNTKDYIVVGHNCESGDIFTPAPGDPEWLLPRKLTKANIGDTLVLESVGSYCASMSTHGYNSFPEAGELLLREDGTIVEIRKRAGMEELWRNEVKVV